MAQDNKEQHIKVSHSLNCRRFHYYSQCQKLAKKALSEAVRTLRSKGFHVRKMREKDVGYISSDWLIAAKDHLLARIETNISEFGHNQSFMLEFYQDATPTGHCNGAVYDRDTLKKAPYLIQKRFFLLQRQLATALVKMGAKYQIGEDVGSKSAYARIMKSIYSSNHYKSELGHADMGGSHNRLSGEGKLLCHGQNVWFRDPKGRWMKGRAFYDLNNMWHVMYSPYDYCKLSSKQIFVDKPDDLREKSNSRLRERRLQELLSDAVRRMDFIRAEKLKHLVFKGEMYRIWSTKHGGEWWRTQSAGYASSEIDAGLFMKEEAQRLCKNRDYLTMKKAG